MSVFLSDTVVYSAIPYEKIKAYMFLRRSLASLARAYKLHVYDFFLNVGTFGGLAAPPPPIPKSWATLLLPAFAHQKSGQMKMADSAPPPPPLATRNRRHWQSQSQNSQSSDSVHCINLKEILENEDFIQTLKSAVQSAIRERVERGKGIDQENDRTSWAKWIKNS